MLAALIVGRPAVAFISPAYPSSISRATACRLFATTATPSVKNNVSRIGTLQQLLQMHGAPGSIACRKPNDLLPVERLPADTPELIASMDGPEELTDLHPYLYPIARSKSSGNYICAYRNPMVEESDWNHPWPIVEAQLRGPGMQLLALNSEHLMRRIVAECDDGKFSDVLNVYNSELGQGKLKDPALDAPYVPGSVEQLGYGVDKYVLLRVGPFPDLYQTMAEQHAAKNDEQSSLIAAETLSSKLSGFSSTFLYYAKLLMTFPGRDEEARDAARMCLRLPLHTIGLTIDSFKDVAVIGQLADSSDSVEIALQKLRAFYEKIVESENEPQQMTNQQQIMKNITHLIDYTALEGKRWSKVRPEVSRQLREAGNNGMADFVSMYQ
jgi:hypothetical protein